MSWLLQIATHLRFSGFLQSSSYLLLLWALSVRIAWSKWTVILKNRCVDTLIHFIIYYIHIVSNDKWIVYVIRWLLFNYTWKRFFLSLHKRWSLCTFFRFKPIFLNLFIFNQFSFFKEHFIFAVSIFLLRTLIGIFPHEKFLLWI